MILACALGACAKKEVTVTETVQGKPPPPKTVTHTVTVLKRAPTPKKVANTPRRTLRSLLPPPPAGVFQVGDKRFLVRPGFEANMHHLCEGRYDHGDEGKTANYVYKLGEVNGDFIVECVGTISKRWADLPFTPVPQKKVPTLPVPSPFGGKK